MLVLRTQIYVYLGFYGIGAKNQLIEIVHVLLQLAGDVRCINGNVKGEMRR